MKYSLLISLLVSTTLLQAQDLPSNYDKEPAVKWRFKIKAPIISSPVVNDNMVYFGGLDSIIYALDVNTGNTKWTAKTNGEIRSTFSIHENKLFVVGGNGVLSCWDKITGKSIWRTVFDKTALFLSERRYDFADYYTSSPLVHNNIIYFGSGNGYLRAINATNGDLIWNFRAQDIVHTTPVIYKDKIFFGSFDGNVYALNLQTGALVWKFKSIGQSYFPLGEIHGTLAVSAAGLVHVGSRDFNIYALEANNGNSVWNKVFDAWAVSHTARDSALYVGTSDNRVLVAYEAATGRQYWKTDVKFNIFGGSAFTKSMVYVGTIWGKLYGIDCKTGAIKWSFATDGHRKNHDQYFKTDDSYRDDIGQILKSAPQWINAENKMGGIFSTPAVANDMIVITTTEGTVYGLARK